MELGDKMSRGSMGRTISRCLKNKFSPRIETLSLYYHKSHPGYPRANQAQILYFRGLDSLFWNKINGLKDGVYCHLVLGGILGLTLFCMEVVLILCCI